MTYVRARWGTRSIQITADLYGRSIPAGTRAAVDALDDARLEMQPEATPAQPVAELEVQKSEENVLVTLNFGSWNQTREWLRRLDSLRGVA